MRLVLSSPPAPHAPSLAPIPDPTIQVSSELAPTVEWAIVAAYGAELFRCSNLEQAYRTLDRLKPLLNSAAAETLRVAEVMQCLDHVESPGPGCASVRDCTWLLRQLGYVTVFAFSRDDSDAQFMVVGRDGQRVERPTLTAALYELLRRTDKALHLPPSAILDESPWTDDDV